MFGSPKKWIRSVFLDFLSGRDPRFPFRQCQEPVSDLATYDGIIIWQPDGKLGDAIFISDLLDSIRHFSSAIPIYMICPANLCAFYTSFNLCKRALDIGQIHKGDIKSILGIAQNVSLLFISMETSLSFQCVSFLRRNQLRHRLGFNVGEYRIFSHAVNDPTQVLPWRHVRVRIENLCEVLNIPCLANTSIKRIIEDDCEAEHLLDVPEKYVLINAYASAPKECFSDDSLILFMDVLLRQLPEDESIVISCEAGKIDTVKCLASRFGKRVMPIKGLSHLDLFSLIKGCRLLLTPDTAPVHIAALFSVPQIVFYYNADYSPVVWNPRSDVANVVLPETKGCINDFDPVHVGDLIAKKLASTTQCRN